jgi:endonuclease/exonuclease/phosphatase family metal-dependent hydrolase
VTTPLPKVPAQRFWRERRTALEASVAIDGRSLWVVGTHLSVPKDQNAIQLEWLLRHLAGRPQPQVVVGDLNRPLELVRPEALAAGLQAAVHKPTFPVSKPRRTIDHVLVSPDLEVVATEVRATTMSDHAALVVELA